MEQLSVLPNEKAYLRELAKIQLEIANLPVMREREGLWYRHNACKGERPLIIMEHTLFFDDLLPKLKCTSEAAKEIERNLQNYITSHKFINDDKVIPDFYALNPNIWIEEFGLEIKTTRVADSHGRKLGYVQEHPIADLQEDFHKLSHSSFHMDKEKTRIRTELAQDVLGDILPIVVKNNCLEWYFTPSEKVVRLMGLENMMFAMIDYPELIVKLYDFLVDDILSYLKWQEEQNLLTLNNGNDYIGSYSFGFTNELPLGDYEPNKVIKSKDLWVNMNSQETVGISAAMYKEFIFPHYQKIAEKFGLVYYGCCEPVHTIWEDCISKLPNLKKVSISPWCDENFMGESLAHSNVIYARKPSPNFLGLDTPFDEEAFSLHISKTIKAAKDCTLEFSFRDIYSLSGDLEKAGKAIRITRDLIDKYW